MTEPVLDARGLRKSYADVTVLNGVDLSVHRGQVGCLIGPSGSGKSTLLRCLNGLERIDAGRLLVNGEPLTIERRGGGWYESPARRVARRRRAVGMVFQQFNLFPHLSVLDNITMAPMVEGGVDRDTAVASAMALLDRVGLRDRHAAMPDVLSGGQRQRVAIARALAMSPDLMLFDEPTSALDPELVSEVLAVMRDLASSGMTMVVATHEMEFVRRVADFVVFLDGGVVVESGPPGQLLEQPATDRARRFLTNVIHPLDQEKR